MIDIDMIEAEIDKLESKDTSFYACRKLAILYNIRDHLRPQAKVDSTLLPRMEGSDFLRSASGKNCKDVMRVIDEHLEAIRLVYPKTYSSLVAKIREL